MEFSFSLGGPGESKMWRSLSAKSSFGYHNVYVLILYNNREVELTFRDLRGESVSIKPVDSSSDLWRPQGDHFCRCSLNLAPTTPLIVIHVNFFKRRGEITAE
jgi:hypothetical protein